MIELLGEKSRYVIAVKRGEGSMDLTLPQFDWQAILETIEGLTVLGKYHQRLQVSATPEGIDAARQLVGDFCHIEPEFRYDPETEKPFFTR